MHTTKKLWSTTRTTRKII